MKRVAKITDKIMIHPFNSPKAISQALFRCRFIPAALVLTTMMLFGTYLIRPAYGEGVSASFLYNLSDFSGVVPFNMVKMFADRTRHEVYVVDSDGSVRIFNAAGMETYRFNEDGSLGNIIDAVVDKEGNILALVANVTKNPLIRCNYRGDLMGTLELKNIPAGFSPDSMAYNDGHIYLVNKNTLQVVVTDDQGSFERSIDLFDTAGGNSKHKLDYEMGGFSVDREGNIFFTLPIQFKAYKLSPDGKVASFGQPGGAAGKFNIAAGIVTDGSGHYFVSDKLKSSILVFNREFTFLTQIGTRGYGPGGLVVPTEMAIMDNQLYVTQSAQKGVSVFSLKQQ